MGRDYRGAVAVDPEFESKIRQPQCLACRANEKPGINPVSVIKWIRRLSAALNCNAAPKTAINKLQPDLTKVFSWHFF